MPRFELDYREADALQSISSWVNAREVRRGEVNRANVKILVALVSKWKDASRCDSDSQEVRAIVGTRSVTRNEAKMLKEIVRSNREDCANPSVKELEELLEWTQEQTRRVFLKLIEKGILKSDSKGKFPYEVVPAEPQMPSAAVDQEPSSITIPLEQFARVASEVVCTPERDLLRAEAFTGGVCGTLIGIRLPEGGTRYAVAARTISRGQFVYVPRDFRGLSPNAFEFNYGRIQVDGEGHTVTVRAEQPAESVTPQPEGQDEGITVNFHVEPPDPRASFVTADSIGALESLLVGRTRRRSTPRVPPSGRAVADDDANPPF